MCLFLFLFLLLSVSFLSSSVSLPLLGTFCSTSFECIAKSRLRQQPRPIGSEPMREPTAWPALIHHRRPSPDQLGIQLGVLGSHTQSQRLPFYFPFCSIDYLSHLFIYIFPFFIPLFSSTTLPAVLCTVLYVALQFFPS